MGEGDRGRERRRLRLAEGGKGTTAAHGLWDDGGSLGEGKVESMHEGRDDGNPEEDGAELCLWGKGRRGQERWSIDGRVW